MLPFSAGQRNCVGINFANLTLRAVLLVSCHRLTYGWPCTLQPTPAAAKLIIVLLICVIRHVRQHLLLHSNLISFQPLSAAPVGFQAGSCCCLMAALPTPLQHTHPSQLLTSTRAGQHFFSAPSWPYGEALALLASVRFFAALCRLLDAKVAARRCCAQGHAHLPALRAADHV